MNCPRCNANVAFSKKRCDNCGHDLKNYRKVVSLSNTYYNKGLSQAKVRDLSGAVSSLKLSLQYNKLNTNARNLLGLIYLEEGEIVAALSEWVISRHYQAENNDAEDYIRQIQSNPNRLETYNQTIRKYNSALNSAKHGDEDMAVIQLKKVVNLNPNFIRAHQLLALLYMMTGKKDNKVKALKLLRHISKIDVTNTTTLRYMKELSDVHLRGESQRVQPKPSKEQPTERRTLPKVDPDAYKTITPYKEERPSIMPFINVVVGMVIGLALMYFLIIPHMKSKDANSANNNFKQYSEQQAADDSDSSSLKSKNESLQKEIDGLKSQLKELQGDANTEDGKTILDIYDDLYSAASSYLANDSENAAKKLLKIDENTLKSEYAKKVYKRIKENTFATMSEKLYQQGYTLYSSGDYGNAIKTLKEVVKYDETNVKALYFLGRGFQKQQKYDKAKKYYETIINDFPDSDRVALSKAKLTEMGY